jgi:uncharacterized protein YxeA
MNSNSKGPLIGLIAVVVIALGALVFFMTRQNAGSSADNIKQLQDEAKKDVPAGIGKPTTEQTQEGLVMMGRGKTSTAKPPSGGPAPGIAPP